MNIILRKLLCVFAACMLVMPVMSQTHKDTLWLNRPVPKVYKFGDNLFWGMSFGGSYSISEYARQQSFFKMLGPGFDFEFGKHLSRQWAARVMLGYHSRQSAFPQEIIDLYPKTNHYSFSTIGLNVDVMFCLDRLFKRYNPMERHQFWLFAGVGGMFAFGYSSKLSGLKDDITYPMDTYPINSKAKIYPACRVGLEWHWRIANSTSLVLRGLYGITNKALDGKEFNSGSAGHFAELSIGFNVRLSNRYGQRHFENCSHNANRYFNVMNDRLTRLHKKVNKEKAKAESKRMKKRVEPATDISQTDSILLFPRDYHYLTDMQKSKLRKMAQYLKEHPNERAHIHIYSDENIVSGMEMEFRVVDRADGVDAYLGNVLKLDRERYVISAHPNESSPYGQDYIFTLGGIIRYEKMPQ